MESTASLPVVARRTIEVLLSDRFGAGVRIAQAGSFWPTTVWRCRLEGGGGAVPPTVVVRLPRDSGNTRSGAAGLAREHAALTVLGDLGCPVAPNYIAGDAAAGVLISEDLGPYPSLLDLLLTDDRQAASDATFAFARALGVLHGKTAGHVGSYTYRSARGGDAAAGAQAPDAQVLANCWDDVKAALVPLALRPGNDVDADVAAVQKMLADEQCWALSSGDPSVVNCVVAPTCVRFCDFEGARFRHAFLDAAMLRYPYPTGAPAWRLPAEVTSRAEREYRTVLGQSVGGFQDDSLYEITMAAACVAWAIVRLARFERVDKGPDHAEWRLLPPDWRRPPPVRSRRRQLVSTLTTALEAAAKARALPAWAGWCEGVVDALRNRWAIAHDGVDLYPAFSRLRQ